MKLPVDILSNTTRYNQECFERVERDHAYQSDWTEPEFDVSCQLRSPIPAPKEVIFLNTTVIKLEWSVQTQSPDCTFSHFHVRYQVTES